MLADIFKTKSTNYEIEPFYSGEALCSEMHHQIFDLIFLDIELQKRSGIDVSKYIRNELKNESVQVVHFFKNRICYGTF